MPTSACRCAPGWLEADFFIAPTQMNCDRLVDGRVIATIERFGVPIGVVKDRRGLTQKVLNQPFESARQIKRPPGRAGRALDPHRARGHTACGSLAGWAGPA